MGSQLAPPPTVYCVAAKIKAIGNISLNLEPHTKQIKPSGHRNFIRKATQESLSGNHFTKYL